MASAGNFKTALFAFQWLRRQQLHSHWLERVAPLELSLAINKSRPYMALVKKLVVGLFKACFSSLKFHLFVIFMDKYSVWGPEVVSCSCPEKRKICKHYKGLRKEKPIKSQLLECVNRRQFCSLVATE